MKLWEVTNGYIADSYVRVLIVAETEDKAKELASEKYKEYAAGTMYPENYWTELEACIIFDDLEVENVDEVEG